MANESLWVRSNLGTYCNPGEHEFLTADGPHGAVRWCARCLKEEPTDGSGCLICDLPGQVPVELESVRKQGARITGLLCVTCHQGFEERDVISGWAEGAVGEAVSWSTGGRGSR
ncbi:MAG: hypothetical protein M0R74_01320 [Dehalococcoidia bacterium]|nr:hypothetical protein [Dehalococcoidia bacterium]